jgi:hypothetical protein
MTQNGLVSGFLHHDENPTEGNLQRNGYVDVPLIAVWVRSLRITVPLISL